MSSVLPEWGVEIDLRRLSTDMPGLLHLSHDPWTRGDDFETWIQIFNEKKIQGPIILNTKEDGLEQTCINLLTNAGIQNFFFLDTAIPSLVQWSQKKKESRFAIRLSVFEPVEGVFLFQDKVQWVWADCFDGIPLRKDELLRVKSKFKVCLVSPELQGQTMDTIAGFKELYPLAVPFAQRILCCG